MNLGRGLDFDCGFWFDYLVFSVHYRVTIDFVSNADQFYKLLLLIDKLPNRWNSLSHLI